MPVSAAALADFARCRAHGLQAAPRATARTPRCSQRRYRHPAEGAYALLQLRVFFCLSRWERVGGEGVASVATQFARVRRHLTETLPSLAHDRHPAEGACALLQLRVFFCLSRWERVGGEGVASVAAQFARVRRHLTETPPSLAHDRCAAEGACALLQLRVFFCLSRWERVGGEGVASVATQFARVRRHLTETPPSVACAFRRRGRRCDPIG